MGTECLQIRSFSPLWRRPPTVKFHGANFEPDAIAIVSANVLLLLPAIHCPQLIVRTFDSPAEKATGRDRDRLSVGKFEIDKDVVG